MQSKYFIIFDWMVNDLKLKTVERDVFSIIYGFCQDKESNFRGSLAYLSKMTGYSRNSICTALKNLTDKKLINKTDQIINNIKFCTYTINFDNVQATCMGVQIACINNIENNKDVSISKKQDIDNIYKNSGKKSKQLFDSPSNTSSSNKVDLYTKCISQIDNFVSTNKIPQCTKIRELLIQHLDIAFENKSIRGERQYKGILKKLKEIIDEGSKYQPVIQYSIEHGYPTFYARNDDNNKKSFSKIKESGKRHVERFTKEDEERLHEFQKECAKKGIRTTF